ncbi:allatostatin-A receptor-like [Contarinia nasturtii]|uniref:allatostatin-A receptor-like n=1 Tax=Contarinia nasturtii TaxID=265458 RepID=UPI0012D3C56C|nr:allatostatin-A receptor-like [Contarinia nasturtii]
MDLHNNISRIADQCATNETDTDFDDTIKPVVMICFSLIGITGFLGNVLVIFVVLMNPQMRSTTNLLIINLAIADLLFVVFCVPFTAIDYVTDEWPLGNAWCKIVQYLIIVTALVSIYTLVLMSLDRFLAVVFPISSRTLRNERNTLKAITILWLLILLTATPVIFAHGVVTETYGSIDYKLCVFKSGGISFAAFHIIFFSSSYLIPLTLISGLYAFMLRLWRTVVPHNRTNGTRGRGRKRVTRLVFVVVAAFALLWFPIQVILLLKSLKLFNTCTRFDILLQIASHVLAYTTACINPLLYAFLSENFRKAFKKVIYCGPTRRYSYHHALSSKSIRTGSTVTPEHV